MRAEAEPLPVWDYCSHIFFIALYTIVSIAAPIYPLQSCLVVVAIPSGCVGSEELHQHGSKDLRSYLVGLTFQGAMLCMGHRLDQRECRDVHKGIRSTAVHDECRNSDAGCFLGGDRGVFPHGSG